MQANKKPSAEPSTSYSPMPGWENLDALRRPVDEKFPLYLTTGRLLVQNQSGAQTRRIRSLNDVEPEAFVELHPDTASGLNIADGELIRVITRRGEVTCKARFSRAIRCDTLFMPFHFAGKGRANTLTGNAVDPVSKIPEFKIAAARLERLSEIGNLSDRIGSKANT